MVPQMTVAAHEPAAARRRRYSARAIAEGVATAAIAAGVVMLMQPFSLTLYGWSGSVVRVFYQGDELGAGAWERQPVPPVPKGVR